MASSAQRDTTHFSRRTGRPPIVLARLPRLGTSARQEAAAQAPPAPNPAPSAPAPESIPQLELRDQIDQRIRLHVADPSADNSSSTSHFADHQHAVDPGHIRLQAEQLELSQAKPPRVPAPTLQSADASQATLSEKLFELHTRLAPHAGLIVALALIASAGLLYWMIVGPAPLPTPSYDNLTPQFHDEGIGSATDYMPDFSAGVSRPTPADEVANQWMKVTLPEPAPAAEELTVEEVTAEKATDQVGQAETEPIPTQPLPEQLGYPSTSHATFDLSKMGLGQPATDTPTALPVVVGPEVAGRPSSTTTR